MIVVSRKPGEQLMIGDDVRITVVRMEGSRVTIAIEAPRGQRILRGELSELADEPLIIEVTLPEAPSPHPTERIFL